MRLKKRISFILLIIALAFIINIKPILRKIYVLNYKSYILLYSKEYSVDPYLVAAIIRAESNFQEDAKSHKDAYGLMQITEPTALWAAKKMGINNFKKESLYNAETNIKIGCWYILDLSKEFNGKTDLVLAAYNGGRTNVKKWLESSEFSKDGENLSYIPFKETDKYIKKVKTNYSIYKWLYSLD
jgi:soluble lytic murein transglycosylase